VAVMRLLVEGRQLNLMSRLKDFDIKKDASIPLIACLRGGARGSEASSASKSLSFKYALKPGSNSQLVKALSGKLLWWNIQRIPQHFK